MYWGIAIITNDRFINFTISFITHATVFWIFTLDISFDIFIFPVRFFRSENVAYLIVRKVVEWEIFLIQGRQYHVSSEPYFCKFSYSFLLNLRLFHRPRNYSHHSRYHLAYHRHVCYTLSMYIQYNISIHSSCFYLHSQCALVLSIWDAEKRSTCNTVYVYHCYWLSF